MKGKDSVLEASAGSGSGEKPLAVLGSQGGKAQRDSREARVLLAPTPWSLPWGPENKETGFWETLEWHASHTSTASFPRGSPVCSFTAHPPHQASQEGKDTVVFWLR